jgi:hypothetical protein
MPRLWLDYPNGRHHEIDYRGDLKFEVGDEFEMHGRRCGSNGSNSPATSASATRVE